MEKTVDSSSLKKQIEQSDPIILEEILKKRYSNDIVAALLSFVHTH